MSGMQRNEQPLKQQQTCRKNSSSSFRLQRLWVAGSAARWPMSAHLSTICSSAGNVFTLAVQLFVTKARHLTWKQYKMPCLHDNAAYKHMPARTAGSGSCQVAFDRPLYAICEPTDASQTGCFGQVGKRVVLLCNNLCSVERAKESHKCMQECRPGAECSCPQPSNLPDPYHGHRWQ